MEARARSRIYAFFSRLFLAEVDAAMQDALDSQLGRALLPAWSGVRDGVAPAELASDFAHVTITNAVPYESFYHAADGMIESGGANPVMVFLQKYGFEADLAAARAVSADHVGIELELMSTLCNAQADAEADGKQDYARNVARIQRAFLEEHLLSFAPAYFMAVERTARTALYREAASAVLDWLFQDHELLSKGPGA